MVVAAAALSSPVGRLCTSLSTITPASPSHACCPTSKAKPPSPSCTPPSPFTPSTASPFAACSPTTAPAIAPTVPRRLPPTRHPAPLHPALYPTHQRQGGTLHSNRPARVGLRSPLPQLRGTRPASLALA